LVEGKVIIIGVVAYVLGMSSKKLHRWYKEVLSGYSQAEERGDLEKDNLQVIESGERTTITVPIIKESNLGKQMAIDEKTINGICYTILSNRETGKIALMTDSLKTKHLLNILNRFSIEK